MSKKSSSTSNARGRPTLSDEKIAKMRRHIADCALKLFQTEGYHAVSMRRLALEAGCTVMTLYRYYDRKIDVLRQLWGEVFDTLFDQLDAIAELESDWEQKLNAISLGYVTYWLEHPEHYFLVFMSSDVSQTDVSVFVDGGSTVQRFALFYECLGAVLEARGNADDLDQKGQVLLCALNGIAHNLLTISAYPWANPKDLVRIAVLGVVNA